MSVSVSVSVAPTHQVFASSFIPRLWKRTETRLRKLSMFRSSSDRGDDVFQRHPSFGEAARGAGDDSVPDDVVTAR